MGAFIYSNKVSNRIVELENEAEKEKRREFLGAVGCFALIAVSVLGLMFRTGMF